MSNAGSKTKSKQKNGRNESQWLPEEDDAFFSFEGNAANKLDGDDFAIGTSYSRQSNSLSGTDRKKPKHGLGSISNGQGVKSLNTKGIAKQTAEVSSQKSFIGLQQSKKKMFESEACKATTSRGAAQAGSQRWPTPAPGLKMKDVTYTRTSSIGPARSQPTNSSSAYSPSSSTARRPQQKPAVNRSSFKIGAAPPLLMTPATRLARNPNSSSSGRNSASTTYSSSSSSSTGRKRNSVASTKLTRCKHGASSEEAVTIDSSSEEEADDPRKPLHSKASFLFIGSRRLGEVTVHWPAISSAPSSSSSPSLNPPTIKMLLKSESGARSLLLVEVSELTLVFFGRNSDSSSSSSSSSSASSLGVVPLAFQTKAGGSLAKQFQEFYAPEKGDFVLLTVPSASVAVVRARLAGVQLWKPLDAPSTETAAKAVMVAADKAGGSERDGDEEEDGGEDDGEGLSATTVKDSDDEEEDLLNRLNPVERALRCLSDQDARTCLKALELSEPRESPRRRSRRLHGKYEPSAAEGRVLLHYPPEKGAAYVVPITRGDLNRLEPFEFLNDNLVDFYFKFMARERRVVATKERALPPLTLGRDRDGGGSGSSNVGGNGVGSSSSSSGGGSGGNGGGGGADAEEEQEGSSSSSSGGGSGGNGGGGGADAEEEQEEEPKDIAALHLAQSHLFTAHFYKKLTAGKLEGRRTRSQRTKTAAESDDDDENCEGAANATSKTKKRRAARDCDEDSAVWDQETAAHAAVARWTKDLDVFSKKFVLVPIVEHLHWSMAIVCNLDCLEDYLEWRRRQRAALRVEQRGALSGDSSDDGSVLSEEEEEGEGMDLFSEEAPQQQEELEAE
eukprot:CAMPEP_0171990266 /NCGR_PEP_ID=MMETSP0993-20121228/276834_1 /TAXON_ID=483369 /ORGANISM="non described non described, Strain CCMP2098" /LENGTH=842 /DNA_ID=CAMNT_0012643269 /DNA_START=24 /DNA_END=2549 /DNA_ORIENTATION=+